MALSRDIHDLSYLRCEMSSILKNRPVSQNINRPYRTGKSNAPKKPKYKSQNSLYSRSR